MGSAQLIELQKAVDVISFVSNEDFQPEDLYLKFPEFFAESLRPHLNCLKGDELLLEIKWLEDIIPRVCEESDHKNFFISLKEIVGSQYPFFSLDRLCFARSIENQETSFCVRFDDKELELTNYDDVLIFKGSSLDVLNYLKKNPLGED
ncbi:hypothetical protein [Aureibacter tunicatorum]|uniref:Uncharacterized protein n=1 Tax=Aureibacter tunicatorum TaxID=866807 RepID=A0AAE4BTK8_9BACT|nr:hypothetical protein [Aureibacter tunicatorum]MDR6240070.1 hypothetical protein [Aureibacter tunicatorum]BDD04541.1 hypothetical protein AUTU_20240 [Aureibacter tunicatorum]